jgi:hypothetical protein
VAIDVLVVKVGIKLWADANVALALLAEDDGELLATNLGVLDRLFGAFLGETLGANDFGIGILLGPFSDEDVVLKIKGDNVSQVAAEFGDLGLGLFCEGDRREDGESAGCESHYEMSKQGELSCDEQ